ncbi:hypothetical protein [Deinococcus cellulosilyticus]|uniref:Uncharacterized protein n=1 Tax=Deinococcus cellulosilyticus (strain DSM 18568 / NBRC 106333 / KACC 11606 / 5516J-15) TaxID=1223518 RepID=A0A511N0D4_DEIC1|nr:hypothetical protein [Deinococcus cellulosilyticus]GEM45928.1 hypothetical protein DC3_15630 [Deinococcus cellulosilyticus NBRC 106333 = KACC 11606]
MPTYNNDPLPRDKNNEAIQVLAYKDSNGDVQLIDETSPLLTGVSNQTPIPYTITFDAGTSTSNATTYANLSGLVPVRLVVPSGWTTADITVQTSADGATSWRDHYDATGNVMVIKAGAGSRSIALNPADFMGLMHIRLRSGLPSSTVAQVSSVSLTLYAAPIGG